MSMVNRHRKRNVAAMWRPCGFGESIAASASRCAGTSTSARDASARLDHCPPMRELRPRYSTHEQTNQTKSAKSVQAEFAVDRFDLGGLDQPRMRHGHRMQRSLELLQPEIEEFVELGKFRTQIVLLPDIGLQKPRMIRPAIEDVGRGQPVALELTAEIPRDRVFAENSCELIS